VIKKLLLSRRYASSFLSYALSIGSDVEQVCKEMKDLCQMISESYAFSVMFRNRAIPIYKKMMVWENIKSRCGLSEITENFISIIIRNGRSEILQDLVDNIELLFFKSNGITKVDVVLVETPDRKNEQELLSVMQKALPFKSKLEFKEDQDILGGAVLLWESNMIDASVRGRLDRLVRFIGVHKQD
jgi:F-type H+-transporting ATPase subunit delta